MNINDVLIKCVEKWTENELDDRINFAMDKFDNWIKDFDEEKDILCKILEKFNSCVHCYGYIIMETSFMGVPENL